MTSNFLKSDDWKEAKGFLIAEIKDRPLNIKTEGLSAERIAIEVRASQIASEKIVKAIKRLERMITLERKQSQPFI